MEDLPTAFQRLRLEATTKKFPFLKLPAELRYNIYDEALVHDRAPGRTVNLALLQVSKQVNNEAKGIFQSHSALRLTYHADYKPKQMEKCLQHPIIETIDDEITCRELQKVAVLQINVGLQSKGPWPSEHLPSITATLLDAFREGDETEKRHVQINAFDAEEHSDEGLEELLLSECRLRWEEDKEFGDVEEHEFILDTVPHQLPPAWTVNVRRMPIVKSWMELSKEGRCEKMLLYEDHDQEVEVEAEGTGDQSIRTV
ncbi:hypothetical protein CLAFUW4_09066 [Fulvia fulva]|uniref:Uncharacterized protein n=1 Tax=Passalora fulva TaxID=5499 RepID=A0A9Q8UTX1_PASFU|nr:uncharacterized protein CLAFUR5_09176 [Fulvia fulva]KAK4613365.1 hypothetical protein CLAFUR4_09072 [Fulvia fulva]KAK4615253.1 hypothetical protein CLAFUR0_09064 [Fulvia fulva]UJO22359.1 hypothetical protein CLAFUR5_09176 [Fulvia fulva]WPV20047.1 hypothetical protein CLAFUW4_09066 [Fulvia fulva]WPV35695.1 hypothetical protein CLAFUW7_09067 [Fulvia fulva]